MVADAVIGWLQVDTTWKVAVHNLAPLVEVLHNVLFRDLIWDAAHIQARAAAVRPGRRRRLRILQHSLQFTVCKCGCRHLQQVSVLTQGVSACTAHTSCRYM